MEFSQQSSAHCAVKMQIHRQTGLFFIVVKMRVTEFNRLPSTIHLNVLISIEDACSVRIATECLVEISFSGGRAADTNALNGTFIVVIKYYVH